MLLKMDGAAGPSGMDVSHWKVCTSFSRESDDLCHTIAMVTRKLCAEYIDPLGVSALVSSRLIALDKNPGVRPIGIGEEVRRVIGKAILSVIKSDIIEVTGCSQLCAGVSSACEAIVHTVRKVACTYVYSCLPLSTHFYLSLLVFNYCLLVFTYVYHCLPMFNPVYSFLPRFTYVYRCLIVHFYLCLSMITHAYLCLHLFTYVYSCLLVFTYIYHCLLVHVYRF